MFGIFKGKQTDSPPTNINEVEKLFKLVGHSKAGELIRTGAVSGNLFCQIFLSQAAFSIPHDERSEKIQDDLELFTKMAAQAGDAGSQFNLGKLHMAKIDADAEYLDDDDIENIKQAKLWYGKAASQGLTEAKLSFQNLEVFDF